MPLSRLSRFNSPLRCANICTKCRATHLLSRLFLRIDNIQTTWHVATCTKSGFLISIKSLLITRLGQSGFRHAATRQSNTNFPSGALGFSVRPGMIHISNKNASSTISSQDPPHQPFLIHTNVKSTWCHYSHTPSLIAPYTLKLPSFQLTPICFSSAHRSVLVFTRYYSPMYTLLCVGTDMTRSYASSSAASV